MSLTIYIKLYVKYFTISIVIVNGNWEDLSEIKKIEKWSGTTFSKSVKQKDNKKKKKKREEWKDTIIFPKG